MTQTETSDIAQLTLDGGEVRHPPPRPRLRCPECEKYVTITADGTLHKHNIDRGRECPRSGMRAR